MSQREFEERLLEVKKTARDRGVWLGLLLWKDRVERVIRQHELSKTKSRD